MEKVLTFWFEECTPKDWYKKDEAFDTRIREQFEETYWAIVNGETERWRETAEGRLAEIIVLDQFARNMFRGRAQAFLAGPQCLTLAQEAIRCGADQELDESKRVCVYMPLMHSESVQVHEKALDLFNTLENKRSYEYEVMHKVIIDQFGRYPHRNAALGRESTPEEVEFMKENTGF